MVVVRIPHEIQEIEGWKVHVDTSLLSGEHKELGDQALKLLSHRLYEITMRLPAGPVAKMKEVPIYLDRNHPIGAAHFHPDGGWLERNGYDPAMEDAVQFADTSTLLNEAKNPGSGSVVLHELAHAYHKRVLGFENEEILAGYGRFAKSGKFDKVDHGSGRKRLHYGLLDHKEYFAEMTETFFTSNDFWPFNRLELMQQDPESYTLMAKIWGANVRPASAVEAPAKQDYQGLRILATLKSQRGEFEEAFRLLNEAEKLEPGNSRTKALREQVKKEQAEAK